jgi:hypothetical protein
MIVHDSPTGVVWTIAGIDPVLARQLTYDLFGGGEFYWVIDRGFFTIDTRLLPAMPSSARLFLTIDEWLEHDIGKADLVLCKGNNHDQLIAADFGAALTQGIDPGTLLGNLAFQSTAVPTVYEVTLTADFLAAFTVLPLYGMKLIIRLSGDIAALPETAEPQAGPHARLTLHNSTVINPVQLASTGITHNSVTINMDHFAGIADSYLEVDYTGAPSMPIFVARCRNLPAVDNWSAPVAGVTIGDLISFTIDPTICVCPYDLSVFNSLAALTAHFAAVHPGSHSIPQGLQPNTNYDTQIFMDLGNGYEGVSNVLNFTTLNAPIPPVSTTNFVSGQIPHKLISEGLI